MKFILPLRAELDVGDEQMAASIAPLIASTLLREPGVLLVTHDEPRRGAIGADDPDPFRYDQVTLRLPELRAVVDTLAIVVSDAGTSLAGESPVMDRLAAAVHRGDLEVALTKLRRDLERRGT